MKQFLLGLRVPALLSYLLVLPFMVLEFTFNTAQRAGIPADKYAVDMIVLFGTLWLLPLAFIAGLQRILRSPRPSEGVLAQPASFFVLAADLGALALVWFAIVADQLPAFVGMPNAD